MRRRTLSVLLSFFVMVAAGCASPRGGPERAEPPSDTTNLLIEIRENGEIGVDGRVVDIRNLRAFVERAHLDRPGASAVVVPHRNASTRVIVQVMDEVRLAGVAEIAFAADKGNSGS